MDKLHLQRLAGINEDKWQGEVNKKKHPPEGLFANAEPKTIVKWLKDNHKEYKSAMSSLNFYINRSGKNLTAERKAELESTKDALRKAYKISETNESLDLIRRLAGLPKLVHEKKDEEESEEAPAPEETEEEIPSIVASIAKKAEGLTGDELVSMIQKVYDAGVEDGIASTKEEEKPEEEITEAELIATTANSSSLKDDAAAILLKEVKSMPEGSSKTINLIVNVKRNHNEVFTYNIKVKDSNKEIKESVKDSKGKEIKVGDKICWTDSYGKYHTAKVIENPAFRGGMQIDGHGRSVETMVKAHEITIVN